MFIATTHIRRYLLILFVFLYTSLSYAQSLAQCDSIIGKGMNALQQKDYAGSIEYFVKAQNMAEGRGWYKQLFIATNAIGQNYYNLLKYGEALNYFTEGYSIAYKKLDAGSKILALSNIANIYVKKAYFDTAKGQYLQALSLAIDNDMTDYEGDLYVALGNVENKLGNVAIARENILKSIDLLKEKPEKQVVAKITLAENDLLAGRTSSARNYAQQLLDSVHTEDKEILLLLIISESFLKEKRYDDAVYTATKAMGLHPDLETKKQIFTILSNIYAAKKSYQIAVQYKDSIINVNTAIDDIQDGSLLKNGMLVFENQDYKNQLISADLRYASHKKLIYFVLIVGVLLFSGHAIIIRNQKKRVCKEYKILLQDISKIKNDSLLHEKKMREQGDFAKAEQERLRNDLDTLKRKLLTQALFTSSRNSLFEEVNASILQKPALMKDKVLLSKITKLQSSLNEESEWETFLAVFEDVNQGILQRIKQQYPILTQNDMRFLAYIYMNLSIKEIASILNITPESCRKRKERIALKIDLPEKLNLYDYILNI